MFPNMDDDIYCFLFYLLFGEQSQSAWLTSLTPAWYVLLLHVHGRFPLADWNRTFIILLLTPLLCWFVMWCYAVSRMVTSSHVLQVFIFRHCFYQLPGEWLATGQHDLAEGRDADTVWQQWRYKLSHTIGVIRIAFTFIWGIRNPD